MKNTHATFVVDSLDGLIVRLGNSSRLTPVAPNTPDRFYNCRLSPNKSTAGLRYEFKRSIENPAFCFGRFQNEFGMLALGTNKLF